MWIYLALNILRKLSSVSFSINLLRNDKLNFFLKKIVVIELMDEKIKKNNVVPYDFSVDNTETFGYMMDPKDIHNKPTSH